MGCTRAVFLSVLCAGLGLAGPVSADAIDDLAPGTWYEIPNSKMRDVCPPDDGYEYSFHCQNVTGAWGGAALDTTRGRMVLFGGGHADYKGNEVYVFDFSTLKWERIWGPTSDAQTPSGGTHEVYDDGNPGSRHTYSGLSYVPPPVDALVSMGGSLWQSGSHADGTWLFSFGNLSWKRGADKADDGFGDPSVFDPVTGHIWRRTNREMTEYDPVADTYTDHFESNGGFWKSNVSAALDSEARLMVIAGDGELDEYRLDTDKYESNVALTGASINDVFGGSAPGLDFDTSQKRFVLWGGGMDVYSYDPSVRALSKHTTTGADPGAVTTSGGVFGRFRYVPSRNVFARVNDVDENVFVFRMAAGTGTPLPAPPDGGVGGASGAAGSGGVASGGGGASSGGAGAASDDDGGCGCSAPARAPGAWLLSLAALCAAWAFRRRRSA